MSYSNNPERLQEMLPYLGSLTRGLSNVRWRVSSGSPNTVAFRIREALWQVAQRPNDFPELHRYARDYSISVQGMEVVARRRTPVLTETIAPPPPAPVAAAEIDANIFRRQPAVPAPFDLTVQSQNSTAYDGPQTVEKIIGMWNLHGAVRRTLYFPEAGLAQRSLAELWLWAEDNQVMILSHNAAVTLAKREPTMLEHSYKPDPEYLTKEFGL